MGEAILSRLLRRRIAARQDVWVSDISPARLAYLQKKYRVATTPQNLQAAREGEVVILAIKPQQLEAVGQELGGNLRPDQLVFSIVAGAALATLSQGLGHDRVVRVMPNIAAQVGQAMSLWTATPQVTEADREKARTILASLGQEIYAAEEKYLDLATAVSGSGPAYVFLFIEAFVDAAVHIGLPRDMATRMVLQTVMGATRLAQESGQHPAQLKNLVTSPGGTTAEALLHLEAGGWRAQLIGAVQAAYQKARGLGQTH